MPLSTWTTRWTSKRGALSLLIGAVRDVLCASCRVGGLRSQWGGSKVAGLIGPEEIEGRALAVVRTVEDELEQAAVDRYIDLMQDRMQG
jgi:hypothetical protein